MEVIKLNRLIALFMIGCALCTFSSCNTTDISDEEQLYEENAQTRPRTGMFGQGG